MHVIFLNCYSELAFRLSCLLPSPQHCRFMSWPRLHPGERGGVDAVYHLQKSHIRLAKSSPGCCHFWVCGARQTDATYHLDELPKASVFFLSFFPIEICSISLNVPLLVQVFFSVITECIFLTQWEGRAVGGCADHNFYFPNFLSCTALNHNMAFQRRVWC